MEQGIFYGVSVGPGDPELLTVKALRVLERCPVVAVPRTGGSRTIALDIARQAVDLEGKELLYLPHRMVRDKAVLAKQYEENAALIAGYLAKGQDVAMLNLGDVSIYSTYSFLAERVAALGYECRMVPGVPSFCACAAALGRSLTAGSDQPLHIYPGSYPHLPEALDADGSKVLMKNAHTLPALAQAVAQRGLTEQTTVISDCGLPTQSIHRVDDENIRSYFSTVLILP